MSLTVEGPLGQPATNRAVLDRAAAATGDAIVNTQVDQYGHLLSAVPATAPTAAAGTNNGTTPPAQTVVGTDSAGLVGFGSGSTPAAGLQSVVSFNKPFPAAPKAVIVVAQNAATRALGALDAEAITANGFTIGCTTAPTGSQAATVYAVGYIVIG